MMVLRLGLLLFTAFVFPESSTIEQASQPLKKGKKKPTTLEDVCARRVRVDDVDGFLWKPASDHTEEPRLNRPMVLFNGREKPESFRDELEVYARNGTQITDFGMFEYTGIYGARYYSGLGDDRYYADEIASKAKKHSKKKKAYVYIRFRENTCIGPIDPQDRNGDAD